MVKIFICKSENTLAYPDQNINLDKGLTILGEETRGLYHKTFYVHKLLLGSVQLTSSLRKRVLYQRLTIISI